MTRGWIQSRVVVGIRAVAAVALVLALLAAPRTARAGDAPLPVRDVRTAVRASIAGPDLSAYLGVVVETAASGVRVVRIVPGSPADDAGLRAGDLLRTVAGRDMVVSEDLDAALDGRRPGDVVAVAAVRGRSAVAATARLGARRALDSLFRSSVFRLAVVPIRFSDDRDPGPSADALRRLLFARTGRTGAGASLADYYRDQSGGRLCVEGDVLPTAVLAGPRAHYASQPMGGGPGTAFQDAADAVLRARGAAAFDDYDGIAFLQAGTPETRAGFALWPHRALVSVGGRRLPYYVHATGGAQGLAIGIHCHEFGHLIGLADAYGAGHRTGCGDFCLMSIGHRGGPRDAEASPFALCALCRMRLGWTDAAVVDPRTPQRIRLAPVESAADQAVVVPLDPRCEEYVVLETRARRGFDAELPSEGLLVWHVGGRPTPGQGVYAQAVDLVEAHGVDVFDASLVRTSEIAFPTARARDLTPDTRPGISPAGPASFALHLTDIVRDADGSVTVTIGVPRRVRQVPPAPWPVGTPDAEGYVVRRDPVTGEDARFHVGSGAFTLPPPPPTSSGRR